MVIAWSSAASPAQSQQVSASRSCSESRKTCQPRSKEEFNTTIYHPYPFVDNAWNVVWVQVDDEAYISFFVCVGHISIFHIPTRSFKLSPAKRVLLASRSYTSVWTAWGNISHRNLYCAFFGRKQRDMYAFKWTSMLWWLMVLKKTNMNEKGRQVFCSDLLFLLTCQFLFFVFCSWSKLWLHFTLQQIVKTHAGRTVRFALAFDSMRTGLRRENHRKPGAWNHSDAGWRGAFAAMGQIFGYEGRIHEGTGDWCQFASTYKNMKI